MLREKYGISNCMCEFVLTLNLCTDGKDPILGLMGFLLLLRGSDGNFWEYGFNVSDLKMPLHCDGDYNRLTLFERNYCDTNRPLRNTSQFKHSWLPNWDGKSATVDRDAMQRNGKVGHLTDS